MSLGQVKVGKEVHPALSRWAKMQERTPWQRLNVGWLFWVFQEDGGVVISRERASLKFGVMVLTRAERGGEVGGPRDAGKTWIKN